MRQHALVSIVAATAVAAFLVSTGPSDASDPSTATAATIASTATAHSAKIVGMSAPSGLWARRIQEVGACGIEARRIFASLDPTGKSQSTLIRRSVKAGMMPVLSYKVPHVKRLINGGYDRWLERTRAYLDSLGVPVAVTFWHEPYGDMRPAAFRAGSKRFLKAMQAPHIAVGPILNGWLLDHRASTFARFTSTSLLRDWDFVAVDSYQSGTAAAPGSLLPARAVPLLATWMDARGFPNKPIGLGEYNGYTAAAIRSAGRAILSTPEVWFALAWNSRSKTYSPLAGNRLAAFKKTKADARAQKHCD
jgi:hypothetical protein